jgi:hypothetical protein
MKLESPPGNGKGCRQAPNPEDVKQANSILVDPSVPVNSLEWLAFKSWLRFSLTSLRERLDFKNLTFSTARLDQSRFRSDRTGNGGDCNARK